METRGMNARIRSLREQSVTTQAHIDMERAKYFTDSTKEPSVYRNCVRWR